MTAEQELDYRDKSATTHSHNPLVRKYLELVQDIIVLGLCAGLFIAMLFKLFHLGKSLLSGTDFSLVIADILFILVLIEVFRLLIIYLEEHRISVATMVEVGIVATLREVILTGAHAGPLAANARAVGIPAHPRGRIALFGRSQSQRGH